MRTKSLVCHLRSVGTSPSPRCSRTFVTLKEARDTVFFNILFSTYCTALTTDGTCFSCFLTLLSFQLNSPFSPLIIKVIHAEQYGNRLEPLPNKQKAAMASWHVSIQVRLSQRIQNDLLSEDKPTSSRSEAAEHLPALG